MTGPSSERTADRCAHRVEVLGEDCRCTRSLGHEGGHICIPSSERTAVGALAALRGYVRSHGDEDTAVMGMLDEMAEALALGARYTEGVMLRESAGWLRDLHEENLAKIRAALDGAA